MSSMSPYTSTSHPSEDAGAQHGENPRERKRPRHKRRLLISTAVVAVVAALLLVNTALVSWQGADATGDSTLSVDGDDIYVKQDGARGAPPLVLIHGLTSSTRIWDAVVPMLATTHRVIRIDLLGHGRSAKPTGGGYLIPEQARRVGAVLDQLGITHAVVIGHSTGGMVATSLAEQRRNLVSALALLDAGPSADAFISNGIVGELLLEPVIGQLLWRLRTDSLIRKAASTAVSRPGVEVPQTMVDDVRETTYHAFTATEQASTDFLKQDPLPDRLAPLDVPLLVIWGADDRRWRPASASQFRTVPGAEIELLPGIGHSAIIEDPQHTADLLLAFVAKSPHPER